MPAFFRNRYAISAVLGLSLVSCLFNPESAESPEAANPEELYGLWFCTQWEEETVEDEDTSRTSCQGAACDTSSIVKITRDSVYIYDFSRLENAYLERKGTYTTKDGTVYGDFFTRELNKASITAHVEMRGKNMHYHEVEVWRNGTDSIVTVSHEVFAEYRGAYPPLQPEKRPVTPEDISGKWMGVKYELKQVSRLGDVVLPGYFIRPYLVDTSLLMIASEDTLRFYQKERENNCRIAQATQYAVFGDSIHLGLFEIQAAAFEYYRVRSSKVYWEGRQMVIESEVEFRQGNQTSRLKEKNTFKSYDGPIPSPDWPTALCGAGTGVQ